VLVSALTGIKTVSAGTNHSLAVVSDGTVWAWGSNRYGELGVGSAADCGGASCSPTPVKVGMVSGAVAVAAGAEHSLALTSDGTVWTWGGTTRASWAPAAVRAPRARPRTGSAPTGHRHCAGSAHSLAAKSDGTAWAWGRNVVGQLGDGTRTQRTTPVQVLDLTGVQAVAAGDAHSLALKSDGSVWAWGWNYLGQLGDGSGTTQDRPVRVASLSGVSAIAAGASHSLALLGDGTVWAWGANRFGQLGLSTSSTCAQNNVPCGPTPSHVSTLSGVAAIAAGESHSLALVTDGSVWAWGRNADGQFGDGTSGSLDPVLTPLRVRGLGGATAIAAGAMHSLALQDPAHPGVWPTPTPSPPPTLGYPWAWELTGGVWATGPPPTGWLLSRLAGGRATIVAPVGSTPWRSERRHSLGWGSNQWPAKHHRRRAPVFLCL
jgi:alpha-tubulin suppressor-like RCC1 family protein